MMVSFNSQVPSPYQGYYTSPGANTAPVPGAPATAAPAPAQPAQPQPSTPRGLSPAAAVDLLKVIKHPIQTIKSLAICTKDLVAMRASHNVSIAAADAVMGQFNTAKQHIDEAPFKNLLPFFDNALDRWSDARWAELKPQVEARVSERAWHPIALEWPDGGRGRDKLTEVDMLRRNAETATDGQIVRALQGANRIQIKDSNAMDYFYPLARANDALILRRNLALIPGQKSMETTFQNLLSQVVEVHAEVQ